MTAPALRATFSGLGVTVALAGVWHFAGGLDWAGVAFFLGLLVVGVGVVCEWLRRS